MATLKIPQHLASKMHECLERTFSEIDLAVFDFTFVEVPAKISDDLKSFWGGYKCDFKLATNAKYLEHKDDVEKLRRCAYAIDGTGSTKFRVDFSRHEFCEDKESFEVGGYTIFGYSPRMFVAEKLRAICQQMPDYGLIVHRNRPAASRARDFVDVQVICETYGVDVGDAEFQEIIKKTFEAKKVPIEWLGRIRETRGQHESDFQSIVETVAPAYKQRLQDFDFYFDFVCGQCSQLEALWDV